MNDDTWVNWIIGVVVVIIVLIGAWWLLGREPGTGSVPEVPDVPGVATTTWPENDEDAGYPDVPTTTPTTTTTTPDDIGY